MSAEFFPPRLNLVLVKVVQWLSPLVGRWFYQVDLEIEPECLERLRAIQQHRLLLLPNHPTFHDPIVVFLLSARLGKPFYYLAAYEQFQGILGWFFQSVGVYSIRRGMADRASIGQTLDLLSQPHCRLVIFAEGGCSFQNDTVMPFRVGAVQMAFQVLNRFAKQGQEIPDLYVVPVSIKYRYSGDMSGVIQQTLQALERALGLPSTGDDYQRLRAIAERVLINLEQEYNLDQPERQQQPWNNRITSLRSHVVQECERQMGLTAIPGEPIRERVYRIQYAIKTQDDQAEILAGEANWTLESVEKATIRLLNFDAIYDGYVATHPSAERFLDTLIRLEREVFEINQPPPKGHRNAVVRIGDPVNLKDEFSAYRQDRNATTTRLVTHLQQSVQANLDRLNDGGNMSKG
jgi:1-acyl-sn-glycerol-3-phosphate acyltransferase